MPIKGRSSRKKGKILNFSQAVIGTSASKSRSTNNKTWVAGSTGKVDKSPSKPKAPSLRGKRIY